MDVEDIDSCDLKKQEELEDITTCCICTEVYTDPKALPCIHTFCMNCLHETGLNTNKGAGDEMPCPICRRLFKIPAEGFPGLPHHFFMERLIQVSNVSKPHSASTASCSRCQQEIEEDAGKETPPAEAHCVDCNNYLCSECSSEHRKSKVTKNHELRGLPISEYESGQNVTADLAPVICEVHEQKVLGVFCADCKAIVCDKCFTEKHNDHNCSDINISADGFRKEIEDYTEALNKCIADAQRKKTEIMTVKEEMQLKVEELQSDVEERKSEIQEIADKHASRLVQSLCFSRQSKLKEIHLATDDIDAYILNLENYNSYCQRLMDKGSAHDICRAILDLSKKAIELQQQVQPMIEREIQNFKLRFRQSELDVLADEDCPNLIGEIEEEDDLPETRSRQIQLGEHSPETNTLELETEERREEGANSETDIEKLKQDLKNNETAMSTLHDSNDKLKHELNAAKTTNNSLQVNNDKDKATYKAQIDDLNKKLDDNKTVIDGFRVGNDKLRKELDSEKTAINSLQTSSDKEKADFKAEIYELKKKLADKEAEIDQLQDSNKKLEEQIDATITASNLLQARYDSDTTIYKAHTDELNQELDNKKREIDKLQDSNDELQQEIDAVKTDNSSLQISNKELFEELNEYEAKMQAIETNNEKLQKELGHMRNDDIKLRVHRKAYIRFISDVDPDVLGDYLKMEDVISIDSWQKITAQKFTAKEKCRSLLDFLLQCDHPSAFLVIRQALERDGHYQHILDIMDKEDNTELCSIAAANQKTIQRSTSTASGLWTGGCREAQCEDQLHRQQTPPQDLHSQFRDKQLMMPSKQKSAASVRAVRFSEVEPRYRAANEERSYNQVQERIGLLSLKEREEQLRIDKAAFEERRRNLEESSKEMPQKGEQSGK